MLTMQINERCQITPPTLEKLKSKLDEEDK